MEEILGVVQVAPLALVPNKDPPEAAVYHLIVPILAIATKPTVPVPHLSPSVVVVIVGIALTVAVTAVLEVEAQLPSHASA